MIEEIIKEIETRCENKLETQATIAESYARMLRHLDVISPQKIVRANLAIRKRYPSKSGLARIKIMAWKIVEKRLSYER